MSFSSILAGMVFLALNFAAASSGALFQPGPWYDTLRKPSWNPPKWAFPVVWSVLYLMIAVAGWLVWLEAGFFGAWLALAVYLIQLILNALWSAIFFGLRRMDLASLEVLALWLSIAVTIALFWPISSTAAVLMVPYLVWVTIAAALNWTVWRMNVGTPQTE